MAILKIIEEPDKRLRIKCSQVNEVTDEIRQLVEDMFETMYDAPGIGLAAPQVGDKRRIVVVDPSHEDEPSQAHCLINPEIVWKSEEYNIYQEGCLSVPKQYADVERPAEVRVRFTDIDGNTQEVYCTGLLATVVQHEIDHLEGILFIDHLSRLKRKMVLKKLRKIQAERDEAE